MLRPTTPRPRPACSRATLSGSTRRWPWGVSELQGEVKLRVWTPEDGGEKWFWGECGSALFGSNPARPEPIGIRMGTFDEDPGVRPWVRQLVAYAAPWEPIPDDGLPRFPTAGTARAQATEPVAEKVQR